MSEYIDKKALLDEICRDNCERSYDGTCHNCRMTETIADFPAADVQPVVHGKWDDYGAGVCCSICGISLFHQDENNNWGIEPSKFAFCPYCGARMDGEQK